MSSKFSDENPRETVRRIVAGPAFDHDRLRTVMRDLLEMADELRVMTSEESKPARPVTDCIRRRRRGLDRN